MTKHITFLLFMALISGCSSTKDTPPETIPLVSALFSDDTFEQVLTINEQEIFTLPVQEQEKFLDYFNNELIKGVREDKIIFNYLKQRIDLFTYDGATLTATESLERNEGNCISLAILTQAYAKLAQVDTTFIEVGTVPVFKKNNNTILISNHFRTKLLAPKSTSDPNTIEVIRAGTVVDYFPAQDSFFIDNANYNDLVTKFYANRAVDALLEDNFNQSFNMLKQALSYKPYDPELINISAVLHRRSGQESHAMKIYEYAKNYNLTSQNLLANYLFIAKNQNNTELVKQLENLLDETALTPFDKIQVAQRSAQKGRFTRAIQELKEVIIETPYLPEPYFELARIYHSKGDIEKTDKLLALAVERSSDPKKRSLFQAKRDAIPKR
ncbi:hypothetical protein L1077_20705 [Pseudoalteromonas luteoviolacea]|uniref:tetratricopeptide repeat protein n=1 Tax=Pseudoalteromonas luteoviolacea TaxID=43657 RepID=UPI001F417594|nr:hypothetical protein [Pseudoalteromonas luteoviolacea]MCF6441861.1 hypothetical protein [Pseudoalteromonas luteoviolacea]